MAGLSSITFCHHLSLNFHYKLKLPDSEKILNKGLVVRIGRNDCSSKHTVCSKTTSKDSNTTTTTKITIDLSPSPTNNSIPPILVPQPNNNQRSHSFKSTSLVLDCLKANHINIPQQLEALKKLYEDVQSDSDADKEVQVLMGRMDREESRDDNTSEISGSWSKMKANRLLNELKLPSNSKIADAKIEKGTFYQQTNFFINVFGFFYSIHRFSQSIRHDILLWVSFFSKLLFDALSSRLSWFTSL